MQDLQNQPLDENWWNTWHLEGLVDNPVPNSTSIWKANFGYRIIEHFRKETPKEAHLLIAGSGNGSAMRAMHAVRPDLKFTLCDWSDAALDIARSLTEAGLGPAPEDYIHADLSEPWPFSDHSFDGVIMASLLEYLPKPELAIAEAVRVTNGWLAVTMVVSPSLLTGLERWRFDPVDPWRMIPNCKRVHHLAESKMLLSFSTYDSQR